MYVRSWMTQPAIGAPPNMSIYDAVLLMDEKDIRRLPITEKDRLLGIVTRSDLEAAVGRFDRTAEALKRAKDTPVSAVMTRDPVTVAPSATLEEAAQVMLQRKVSGLPVVQDDKLIGMITESDIFRALCAILGFRQPGGRVVLTLKSDSDLLAQLQESVGKYALQGIVSYHDPETNRVEAVVRVRGRRTDGSAKKE